MEAVFKNVFVLHVGKIDNLEYLIRFLSNVDGLLFLRLSVIIIEEIRFILEKASVSLVCQYLIESCPSDDSGLLP